MKTILSIILILGFTSCKINKENEKRKSQVDNIELSEIYSNDQADRQTENLDWRVVSKRDSLRMARVYELLEANQLQTSTDYHNAALIFQHGEDSTAYGMAVKLMQKSIELDSTANKWLLAAAIDRYLLSKDEPQIYGTQYQKLGEDALWELGKIDTTKISDAERIEYEVETLAQQRDKVKKMNSKKLFELVENGKTVDEVIAFINSENKANSKFDLSEDGVNDFGYQLIEQEKNKEALKIFKLNTELYPNEFNTYDSYGECLLLLGKKAEGIIAYKKSLALNPKNEQAKIIIEQNK